VNDLFGGAPAAEVDLREVVEELLVSQVEAFEVQRQLGRGLDGLAVAAVLGRYVSGDVAVAHAALQAVSTGPLR
jgi:aryl carrier-like protein